MFRRVAASASTKTKVARTTSVAVHFLVKQGAEALIRGFEALEAIAQEKSRKLVVNVSALDLPVHVTDLLTDSGIATVTDLRQFSKRLPKFTEHISVNDLKEIKERLLKVEREQSEPMGSTPFPWHEVSPRCRNAVARWLDMSSYKAYRRPLNCEDLVTISAHRLLCFRNFGDQSARKIHTVLERLGFPNWLDD